MPEAPLSVEPEGVRAEARKTGHQWLDLLVAGCAILLSLISLAVAIHHGEVQERLVAANSWPFVQASTSNQTEEGEPVISLELTNGGEGPALLKSVRVTYRGRVVRNAPELLRACCDGSPPLVVSSSVTGQVLPAGETIKYLQLARTPANQELWNRLNQERWQLRYEACYCSVLGDCWQSPLEGLEPRPVDACPIREDSYR